MWPLLKGGRDLRRISRQTERKRPRDASLSRPTWKTASGYDEQFAMGFSMALIEIDGTSIYLY